MKLLERVRDTMRLRHLARKTENAYTQALGWASPTAFSRLISGWWAVETLRDAGHFLNSLGPPLADDGHPFSIHAHPFAADGHPLDIPGHPLAA